MEYCGSAPHVGTARERTSTHPPSPSPTGELPSSERDSESQSLRTVPATSRVFAAGLATKQRASRTAHPCSARRKSHGFAQSRRPWHAARRAPQASLPTSFRWLGSSALPQLHEPHYSRRCCWLRRVLRCHHALTQLWTKAWAWPWRRASRLADELSLRLPPP